MTARREKEIQLRTIEARLGLRFDERGLSSKLLSAKRQAFIETLKSSPGALFEIVCADLKGWEFWMSSLRNLSWMDRSIDVRPDVDVDLQLSHSDLAFRFEETRNPVYAAFSFCVAKENGVDVPEIVDTWLVQGLRKWLDSEGKESLEQSLGLSGGKTPAFKSRLLEARDLKLLVEMVKLRSLPLETLTGARRVSIAEAAALVASRVAANPWNKTKWAIDQLSAATLEKRYKHWPSKRFYEENFKSPIGLWTPGEIRHYLLGFPEAKLGPKLRVFLQDSKEKPFPQPCGSKRTEAGRDEPRNQAYPRETGPSVLLRAPR